MRLASTGFGHEFTRLSDLAVADGGGRRAAAARVHAGARTDDEHAGAMNVYMTMMRTGLFLQREGSGSEPGNSLVCPLGVLQCRASLVHKTA